MGLALVAPTRRGTLVLMVGLTLKLSKGGSRFKNTLSDAMGYVQRCPVQKRRLMQPTMHMAWLCRKRVWNSSTGSVHRFASVALRGDGAALVGGFCTSRRASHTLPRSAQK